MTRSWRVVTRKKIVWIYCYYRTSPTVNFSFYFFFLLYPYIPTYLPYYIDEFRRRTFKRQRIKCNAHGRDNRMTDLTVQRYYIIITIIILKIWEKIHECIRFHIYIFILRRRMVIYRFIHIYIYVRACVRVLNNIMNTIQYNIIMVPTKQWIYTIKRPSSSKKYNVINYQRFKYRERYIMLSWRGRLLVMLFIFLSLLCKYTIYTPYV